MNSPIHPVVSPAAGSGRTPVDLSIIIVNWNSADYVRKCVASIYKFTNDLRFEIIVVDSASFDGCGEMLAREFPAVMFIQSGQNIGFAKANNLGVGQARGAALLFLNPDTELCGSAINILFAHLQNLPGAGAVGAKLLNADRTLQKTCIQSIPTILNQAFDSDFLRRLFPKARCWGMAAFANPGDTDAEVEMLSGACILAKRSVFEEVGMFTTDYFMYCEDADLCHKIRKAGCKNYYIPGATIIHYGGASSQQSRSQFSNVMMRESICCFFVKTRGRVYGIAYRMAMLLSAALRLGAIVVVSPFGVVSGNELPGTARSFRKWAAVMGWTLGREKWVRKYR